MLSNQNLCTPFSVKNLLNLTDQANCLDGFVPQSAMNYAGMGPMGYHGGHTGMEGMGIPSVSLSGHHVQAGTGLSIDTMSSCEYGGGGGMLHASHPGPPPPSYTSFPDLTQGTIQALHRMGTVATDFPMPPHSMTPPDVNSTPSPGLSVCNRDELHRDITIHDKSKYL